MAKLSSYYTLCPLIDQQNLLGIEEDSNPGCAIVTLGRNIVIRYKLQDVKQVTSWSSKERLTTQVVYDQTSDRYAAVFNGRIVKVWKKEETNLDSLIKYKFSCTFYAILTSHLYPPIFLQQNGATASLEWAINNRKSWNSKGVLKLEEKILYSTLVNVEDKLYVCLLTKLDEKIYCLIVPLKHNSCVEDQTNVKRIELKNSKEKLVGYVVIQDKHNSYLLTLWSSGFLYKYSLISSETETIPGNLVNKLGIINTKYPVVLVPLNESTIAAYGADMLEEGAVLIVYNVNFKLIQATQKLKLFTNDAKLWRIEDKLILAANKYLAVVPYQLAPEKIEARLGSCLQVIEKKERSKKKKPIHEQVLDLQNQGCSNEVIHHCLVPQIIDSKNMASISWYLNKFHDLSEDLLIQFLTFCLKLPDENCNSLENGSVENGEVESDISFHKNDLINKVLESNFSYFPLLSRLKTTLNFDEVLQLLMYLIQNIEKEVILRDVKDVKLSNKKLCAWTILLLDSHYQQYLLSRDSKVSKLFQRLQKALESNFQVMSDLQNTRPMIVRLLNGKPLQPVPKDVNKFYSIEDVKLY